MKTIAGRIDRIINDFAISIEFNQPYLVSGLLTWGEKSKEFIRLAKLSKIDWRSSKGIFTRPHPIAGSFMAVVLFWQLFASRQGPDNIVQQLNVHAAFDCRFAVLFELCRPDNTALHRFSSRRASFASEECFTLGSRAIHSASDMAAGASLLFCVISPVFYIF